jgi:PAS domain S-box-containing protein
MAENAPHILLVEDEEAHRILIQRAFDSQADHLVLEVVANLNDAHQAISRSIPDLVITDLNLPDGKGVDLLTEVKDNQRFPLVVMTSQGDEEIAVDAMRLGALDYLVKSPEMMADLPHLAEMALREWNYLQERKEMIGQLQKLNAEMEVLVDQRTVELQESYAENIRVLESINSILISVDADNRIVKWNRAAELAFNRKASVMVSQDLARMHLPWDWERIKEGMGTCRAEQTSVRIDNVKFNRSDEKDGYLGITFTPIVDDTGQYVGTLLLGADITERLALESRLLQAQKLESIGGLASGMAHEINTPIQYVGDNVNFLKSSFRDLMRLQERYAELLDMAERGPIPPKHLSGIQSFIQEIDLDYLVSEIAPAIEQTMEGVERIVAIVRAMKHFAHPGRREKTATDLVKSIESTLTVARNEWKYVAQLKTDFQPDLPLVLCFPGEFNQVILNLIVNAAHAIGELLGENPSEQGLIEVSAYQKGPGVEIRISDSGTGIPEEIQEKLFDPFFTTKDVGKGTGQGLALAHDVIVNKHGGQITVESEVRCGTTFAIYLPLTETEIVDKTPVVQPV